ncbi:unnamed protein product [Peniophora sp. CBMAI 1063]|nr:unnamed protein product [Peniophora sp. CBMAI 1063]
MPDNHNTLPLVTHLIGAASIVALTFGVDHARERVMRFLRQAYKKHTEHAAAAMPDGVLPEATFYDACLHIPGLNDPGHVWVTFWEGLNLHYADPYWINIQSSPGEVLLVQHYLLAVNTVRPDLVIASHLWIPYKNTQRSEQELEQTCMLPLYFTGPDNGVGVPLSTDEQGLSHLSNAPTGFKRQTVYVRLHLHGYEARQKQIRLRNGTASPNASTRHLARQILLAVRDLITNAVIDVESATVRQWVFGSGEGQISLDDIMLLGFVHISQGKITPLLGLRESFQLPPQTLDLSTGAE